MAFRRRFRRFEVRPFTGALGAEIIGVDLTSCIGESIRATCNGRSASNTTSLAVRGQELDAADACKRSRAASAPSAATRCIAGLEGYEDIVRFVREPDDTGKVIGEDWHMDLAWLPKPPGITMLYAEEIPPVGGDTCFTSLEKAYRSLSPKMVALLGDPDRHP